MNDMFMWFKKYITSDSWEVDNYLVEIDADECTLESIQGARGAYTIR
jgi:hypothetical protein